MRRINAEIQGGKVQEYWRISSLSDAEVQYLDKQKIQDLVGGSILSFSGNRGNVPIYK